MAKRKKKAKATAGINKRSAAKGKKAPSQRSPKRCYLLEMPPEVRNRICELVLYQPEGVEIDLASPTLSESHQALARTARQLNRECDKRFFNLNTFTFRLSYSNSPEDPDYPWADEREAFNEFIEHHVASSRDVRLELGAQQARNNATYFFENLKSIRSSLRKLLNNNVSIRFLTSLSLARCNVSFDIGLADRDVVESEIEERVRAAMVRHVGPGPEKEVEAMQRVIGNTLFGIREDDA